MDEHQDYDYEITGVGSLKTYDPKQAATLSKPIYATQCAIFTRRDDGDDDFRPTRSPIATPLPFFAPLPDVEPEHANGKQEHTLRGTYMHDASPEAAEAASPKEIRQAVAEVMVRRLSTIPHFCSPLNNFH